jgi:stringent starvation protein B
MPEISTKPYLLRAIHEWCSDSGHTPYITVVVDPSTIVPRDFVRGGEIVLNLSLSATNRLVIGNELIEFQARFGGRAQDLSIPVDNVSAIYARENGHGMAFEVAPRGPISTEQSSDDDAQLAAPQASQDPLSEVLRPMADASVTAAKTARRGHLSAVPKGNAIDSLPTDSTPEVIADDDRQKPEAAVEKKSDAPLKAVKRSRSKAAAKPALAKTDSADEAPAAAPSLAIAGEAPPVASVDPAFASESQPEVSSTDGPPDDPGPQSGRRRGKPNLTRVK